MTDQPISKEERDALEAARSYCKDKIADLPMSSFDGITLKFLQAFKALDRARTPKPLTLEDRMLNAATSVTLRGDVPAELLFIGNAARVAQDSALEKLKVCLDACETEILRPVRSYNEQCAMHFCRDAIAKLIEEESRGS